MNTIKFKNKNKVKELQEKLSQGKLNIEQIPKDILRELLYCAVDEIDDLIDGENDQRDFKDVICDKRYIMEDLFQTLQEKIDIGLYE